MSEFSAQPGEGGAVSEPGTILLVDDEENILSSLKRLLRRDGYRILTANGGAAGLEILAGERVDVILSDQRMPYMTGVEFLRQVKNLYPDTVRMVLSGYTELQSITDAINEGAIYKFLTKPWDDEQLRAIISEAFRYRAMAGENKRLAAELARANGRLQQLLLEQGKQLQNEQVVLGVMQEILQVVPLPIIGLDDDGLIVCSNAEADRVLGDNAPLIGSVADERLPAVLLDTLSGQVREQVWTKDSVDWRVTCHRVGGQPSVGGRMLILSRQDTSDR